MLRAACVCVLLIALAASGCGGDDDDRVAAPTTSTGSAAPGPATPPPTNDDAGAGGDAEAYAKVVMSTNMNTVFSGYTIDGSVVTFQVLPGTTLDEEQCQYLRLSNRALREAAGITVTVDDNGTQREC